MIMEKKKYPIGAENYMLFEEVGTGVSASVLRAICIPHDEIVAIKILDFERDNCDLNNIFREAQTMVLVDHPNIVKSHCSFVHDHNLWVVMPFMAGGSCLHILKANHRDGFEEVVIATILREVLKGLEYLHNHGHIHRDVKAGNILIDSHGAVKLGDFGVSACLFDAGDRKRMRNTFVGTPCWMAPEVMEQVHGYDFKADIWSFGITALELAHGHAPFSKYPPMKVFLMTLQNAPPGLDYERDHKFSKSFKQMIASCLVKDPSRRPSAQKLLKHSFFKQARSNDYIARMLLDGLPALGDRLQAIKLKEEEMLAQKKMPDGKKEEISQNEYKCGISSWNFNLDDLKAQASLIPDEDLVSEQDGNSSSLSTVDLLGKKLQHQLSFASHNSEAAESDDNPRTPHSSADFSIASNMNEKSDENISITSSTQEHQVSQKSSPRAERIVESNFCKKPETEVNGKVTQGILAHSPQSSDASVALLEDGPFADAPKALKTPASNDELDEKTKPTVVQQKGRFKVTSVNVEPEKVAPSVVLQKSHSMQVIPQHPAVSPILLSEATPVSLVNHSLFPMLQSILQSNIAQRDAILNLMKQISGGEPTVDGGSSSNHAGSTEKFLLEAAHDKEKELLREANDLQWRLICAQEELQKYKTENA
ncbi:non-receptor serine/threonine protein kinase [Lithospermum erythrorhizon]|uniref:Non-receptor serine/threonine protein kinase n=1 Tax=Lithospermum erythrorhizon TaxID=34254 RepID=A0AAV3PVJ6_LITER